MVYDRPVFMNDRDEAVHFIGNVSEMRWPVISNVNRALTVTSPKLSNVCDRDRIQRPQRVLVERLDALSKAYFDAAEQKVVLSQEVLLLDFCKQLGRVFFSNGHSG